MNYHCYDYQKMRMGAPDSVPEPQGLLLQLPYWRAQKFRFNANYSHFELFLSFFNKYASQIKISFGPDWALGPPVFKFYLMSLDCGNSLLVNLLTFIPWTHPVHRYLLNFPKPPAYFSVEGSINW